MKKLYIFIALFLFFSVQNSFAQWEVCSNGMPKIEIKSILINGNNIFAGTAYHGVYLSTNNGNTWVAKNIGLLSNTIYSFTIKGNNLFVGTDNGVYLSTDNGETWTPKNNDMKSILIYSLSISNNNILAGTYANGLYQSTDNGNSWVKLNIGSLKTISSLYVRNNYIFAGAGNGFYLSTDNGNSWSLKNNGLPANSGVSSIAVNGNNIFASCYNKGIYLSTNNGSYWTQVNNGLKSLGIITLYSIENKIYAGLSNGEGLYISTDNGKSWFLQDTGIEGYYSINTICNSENNIFVGTGGVYLSIDDGKSWYPKNNGLTYSIVKFLYANGKDLYACIGGDVNAVYLSSDNGNNWTKIFSDWNNYVYSIIISGDNIIVSSNGISISKDKGISWIKTYYLSGNHFSSFCKSGTNVFAGVEFDTIKVYLTTDNGISWIPKCNGLANNVSVNSLCSYGQNILASMQNKGVYLSIDNGNNWYPKNNGLGIYPNLYTLGVNVNRIFAGGSGEKSIFISIDSGDSWSDKNIGILKWTVVHSFTFSGNNVFAGTHRGVYLSTDNGESWSLNNNGLSDNMVMIWSIQVLGDYVFAGTDGSGIHRAKLSDFGISITEKPTPPNNLTATSINSQIKLSWEASTTPGVKYNVYRREKGTNDFLQQNGGNPVDGLEYIDNLADHAVWYEYIVRAYDPVSKKESDNSNIAEARWLNNDAQALLKELENTSSLLEKLENLIQDDNFDIYQNTVLQSFKKILGNYKKGYDVSMGRNLVSEWKTNLPDDIQKANEAVLRLNNFLKQILLNGFTNEAGGNPGVLEMSSEAAYGLTSIIDNIFALVFLENETTCQKNEFYVRIINETARFCLNEVLELAKRGDTEPAIVNTIMDLGTVFETQGKIGFEDIETSMISFIINTVGPYFIMNRGLSDYINQTQGFFQNAIINTKNQSFDGTYGEAYMKCNTREDTIAAITSNYKNQWSLMEGLCKLVNFAASIVNCPGIMELSDVQFGLATKVPQILGNAVLLEQRNSFIYGGPLAVYYYDYDLLHSKYQPMPVLINNALGASFHPSLYIIDKKNNSDKLLMLKGKDYLLYAVDTTAFIDEENYLIYIQTHIQNSDTSYVYNYLDTTQERGYIFIDMVDKLAIPLKGIPASLLVSDTNLAKQVSCCYQEISQIKGIRSLVTTYQILYLAYPADSNRFKAIWQIDTFLVHLHQLFIDIDKVLTDNSQYLTNPAFYLNSAAASETSDKDVYDVTFSVKNVGASLSGNGKIIVSFFADSVNIISSDTIKLQSFNSQEEKSFPIKAFLISYTGKVNLFAEFVLDGITHQNDFVEFEIPKTIVSVKNESENIIQKNGYLKVYPNPLSDKTTIEFINLRECFVSLKLIDLLGNEVLSFLDNKLLYSGLQKVEFETDKLTTGTYFCTLKAGNYIETVKFIVIK